MVDFDLLKDCITCEFENMCIGKCPLMAIKNGYCMNYKEKEE